LARVMAETKVARRRGHGEDAIYLDAAKNRYVEAISAGHGPDGRRIRRKVTGRTKAEVRDKLRVLHRELEIGVRPRQRYTVSDALDDWLADGLGGVSARTVTLYRDTIAKALREQLGAVRLTDLTAGHVEVALAALASRSSTRTVQIAHNVLVRAIRHGERHDLVARNVATLVKPPKGHLDGRPSEALTLEQTAALISAAEGTRLEAYIIISLLAGLRTEEVRALRWDHVVAWVDGQWKPVAEVGFDHDQIAVFVWRSDRAGGDTKTRSPGGRWRSPGCVSWRCGSNGCGRRKTGWLPGRYGKSMVWCSPRPSARRRMITMSAGSSARSPRPPGSVQDGCRGRCGTRSSRCCPRTACQSRRSRCWSVTITPLQPS
jgi:hypothetical protein